MADAPKSPDCVLCGCCLEGCPLMSATGREELSPRAKALLAGPSKFMDASLPEADVAALTGLCLACGRCEKLCPQGVQVPALMAAMRASHPDFKQWMWKQWITRLGPYWSLAAKGAALTPDAFVPASLGLALKGLKGLRPGGGLRPWLGITKFPREAFGAKYGQRPVVLFDGCVGKGPRGVWAETARFLLNGLGAKVVEGRFSCCGSTLGVAGLPGDQAHARVANIAAWREAGRPLVVTYCATCRKGLLDYASAGAEIFESDVEAAQWREAVTPLSELLAGAKAKIGRGAPALVAWHEPCHAAPSDLALMKSLLGTRLRTPAKARCCGFGGILQLSAPELSGRVGADCWAGLLAVSGGEQAPEVAGVVPPYVLTGCSGCVMQLAATAPGALGARAGHWLEIVEAG